VAAATAASRSRPQDKLRALAASRSLALLALADGALAHLAARLADGTRGALALAQVRTQASAWGPAQKSEVARMRCRTRCGSRATQLPGDTGELDSRSPEPEPPPPGKISRLIALLPADEWEAQQNETEALISNHQAQVLARTPSRSGHSLHGSTPFVSEEWRRPGSVTFLTPGDSKTMQIQVRTRGLRPWMHWHGEREGVCRRGGRRADAFGAWGMNRIQVKELEAEVASLAQELHLTQQEKSR